MLILKNTASFSLCLHALVVFRVEFPAELCVNRLLLMGMKQSDALSLLSFPRLLCGSAGVVRGLVSHGPQGGRAGDAPWFGYSDSHPATPAFTPHPVLPSATHLLLPTATAPAYPGKGDKT